MQREEMIEHWCDIVRAVFTAEDRLPAIWMERLKEAKKAEPAERDRICDGYVRAIAEELVSNGWTFDKG